ncbi:MAG: PepSY-like domain-containing protein [Chitinophagaceae bacterium]
MKKLSLLLLLAGAAILPASAQKHSRHSGKKSVAMAKAEKAPDAVEQAFQQKYASITVESWHKMASDNWYADFNEDSGASKAEFTPGGQWVATRTALTGSQLPDTISKAIQQKYPGAAISQVTHIERSDVAPYYEISLQINGAEKDILANNSGVITN